MLLHANGSRNGRSSVRFHLGAMKTWLDKVARPTLAPLLGLNMILTSTV